MKALLDANVLIDLKKAGCLRKVLTAWDRLPWELTRAVRDELRKDFPRDILADLPVRPSPPTPSGEHTLASELVTGTRWKPVGAGEASSIAAAAFDPDLVFVTWDRLASWISLHELRGRTLTGHTWLAGGVDLAVLRLS